MRYHFIFSYNTIACKYRIKLYIVPSQIKYPCQIIEGGNNLFYLPLDRMLKQSGREEPARDSHGSPLVGQVPTDVTDNSNNGRFRDTNRSRETR